MRLGLRDGLVVHLRSSALDFPHVLVIDGDIHPIPRSAGPDLHSAALVVQADGDACAAVSLRFLSLDYIDGSCELTAYEIEYCAHATRVRALAKRVVDAWPSGVTSTSPDDIASLFVDCAREFDPILADGSCQSSLIEVMLGKLSVNLGQGTGDVRVDDAPVGYRQDYEAAFNRRRGLADIEQFGISARVVTSMLNLVQGAISRSDSEILIALAAEMYRIDVSNRLVAEETRLASQADAQRDQRWSKLAAASIFPLLLLSFLGANVIPQTLWGHATQGGGPVVAALALTVATSVLGYLWAGRRGKGTP